MNLCLFSFFLSFFFFHAKARWMLKAKTGSLQEWWSGFPRLQCGSVAELSISDFFLWVPYLKIKLRGLGGSILIMNYYLCQHAGHLSFNKSESPPWDWLTHRSFSASSFALFLSRLALRMKAITRIGTNGKHLCSSWLFKMFQVRFCCL